MRKTINLASRSPFVCPFCTVRKPTLRPLAPQQPHSRRAFTRPSFAPKPILDIKHIIRNPGLYTQNCEDRNYKAAAPNAWKIHELAQERAQIQNNAKDTREAYNKLKGEIERLQRSAQRAKKSSSNDDKDVPIKGPFEAELSELLSHAKAFKEEMSKVTEQEKSIEDEIQELALALPNLSSVHTPVGDEAEVLEIIQRTSPHTNTTSKSHVDIGLSLSILDFSASATTSGWGFYFLKNEGALLEQALIQYTLHLLRTAGWTIVAPPSIVYTHIAAACGFQPRDQNDEQQIYHLQQPTRGLEAGDGKPGLSLAATAEIPLAGMYAGKVLQGSELPVKMAAVSRCYRAEAGARGVDTKGLYRVHEFSKVEMFAWTMPDERGVEHFDTAGMDGTDGAAQSSGHSHSAAIFDEIVTLQRKIYDSLNLSYRVMEMPTGDLGGPATRKIDIEAFFPSRKEVKDDGWGEITSTSICTDYQSRRLGTRVKSEAGMEFPHTVNGTAVAVPRVLAALLENGWDEATGTVEVPEVLTGWMGGIERIGGAK